MGYPYRCVLQVELSTSVEHCNHLKHEKGTLLMQLQEAEKRADLATTRAAVGYASSLKKSAFRG